MYFCGPLHMEEQRQDNQLELTYSSSVPIRDVVLKTIEKGGEKGSGISKLMVQHDDDDDDDDDDTYIHSYLASDHIYVSVNLSGNIYIYKNENVDRFIAFTTEMLSWKYLNKHRMKTNISSTPNIKLLRVQEKRINSSRWPVNLFSSLYSSSPSWDWYFYLERSEGF